MHPLQDAPLRGDAQAVLPAWFVEADLQKMAVGRVASWLLEGTQLSVNPVHWALMVLLLGLLKPARILLLAVSRSEMSPLA